MDRRTVLAWLAASTAAGCGGGGGGGTLAAAGSPSSAGPAGAPAPSASAPAPAPVGPPLSPSIALWGDSLTPPVALNLGLLMPDRTIFNGGVVGDTSSQVLTRERADPHPTWITNFWMGHNNDADPEQIKADIAASIALLSANNTHYIVMGLLAKARADEFPGTPQYQTIITLNQQLAATYQDHYIDMLGYLVAQYDPTSPQDVQDHANGLVPSSLRFDEIHLNNNGSILVAKKIQAYLIARGW